MQDEGRTCSAPIHVLQAGAVTKGQKGEVLADIDGMVSPRDSGHQRGREIRDERGDCIWRGMKNWRHGRGLPVLAHCEDAHTGSDGGCVNEDENPRAAGPAGHQ